MALDLSSSDIQALGKAMAQALKSSGAMVSGRTAPRQSPAEDLGGASRNTSTQLKNQAKHYKDYLKAIQDLTGVAHTSKEEQKKFNKALKNANNSLGNSTEYMEDAALQYRELANKSLPEQIYTLKNLSKATDGLSSNVSKSVRNASLFSAALLESHSAIQNGTAGYKEYIKSLGSATKGLDEGLLKTMKLFDATTKDLKDNLDVGSFSRLRVKLGEAEVAISESMAQLGMGSLEEILSKADSVLADGAKGAQEVRDALVAAAVKLQREGFNIDSRLLNSDGGVNAQHIQGLSAADVKSLAQSLASISKTNKNVIAGLDVAAKKANSTLHELSNVSGFLNKKFSEMISTGGILASLDRMKRGVQESWKAIEQFNIAQVPASFANVQAASIKMGMSFEETTRFMQENKRILAVYGQEGFGTLTGNLKDTFAKFGYSMKQGAEMVGPAIEAGISSGINVRSTEGLTNFIDQSMDSFKNISGIVDITAKDYMKLNAELLNSQDIASTMIGMDQQRAIAYGKQLVAMRDNYIQMGLSTQQAQDLLRAQQAQQREKVTSRIEAAAKGQMLARTAGLSGQEAQEYFQLSLKGNKSDAEMKRLTEISGKIGVALEEQRVAGYDISEQVGMMRDVRTEQLMMGGPAGELIAKGMQFAQAKRAGTGLTPEEARARGEQAQGSEGVASMSNAINSVTSLLSNSFFAAIAGAGGALFGLMAQSALTTAALGGVAAAAGGSTIMDKIGGLLGKGGGLSKMGSIAKIGAGVGAIGGIAADYAGSKVSEAGYTKTGAGISILGSMAGGAAMGSIIPGYGTLIGGALGLGKGIYENWGNLTGANSTAGQLTASQPTSVGQPGAASAGSDVNNTGIVNVVDTAAQQKLTSIAESLVETVKILQKMSDAGTTVANAGRGPINGSTLTSSSIPTAYEYAVGRKS